MCVTPKDKEKSSEYRIITFFSGADIPNIYDNRVGKKLEKNITDKEKTTLFRVMTWRPCLLAVEAISPSLTGIIFPEVCALALISPHIREVF